MEGAMSKVGIRTTSALVGLVVMVSGCGSSEADGTTSSRGEEASPSPSADNEVKLVEGRFDVGGHKLYLRCTGEGSPTVVYLHGYIFDPSGGDSSNSGQIPSLLEDENRVCIYDRANVGQSDSVKGPLTGKSSIQDLHALLDAAKIEDPYVLVGGSFGGLLAYMYSTTYPEEVVGMVLLDPTLPSYDADDDWRNTVEKVDQLATKREAIALQGDEPPIPFTLIGQKVPDIDFATSAEQAEELRKADIQAQQEFADRFPHGKLVLYDVPHYMEPEIPEEIAAEIRAVIDAASP